MIRLPTIVGRITWGVLSADKTQAARQHAPFSFTRNRRQLCGATMYDVNTYRTQLITGIADAEGAAIGLTACYGPGDRRTQQLREVRELLQHAAQLASRIVGHGRQPHPPREWHDRPCELQTGDV